MKKIYAVVNFLVVVLVILWNYWSNTGVINGNTVGQVSDKYSNLFTPADYAFSIWGLIFLGLLILTGNQLRLAFDSKKSGESILQIGPWLTVANIGNGLWLWFWLNEEIGITVIIMLVILFSLIMIILRTNMERWNAPFEVIAFVWWPICLYSGWIAVATISNITVWLTTTQWNPTLTDVQWTMIAISLAGILNLFMIYTRNMREFAGVGVWALIAIAVRHWETIPELKWCALTWTVVLLIATGVHGYKNRKTNPLYRWFSS
ncbi:MAG: tryptophan-rich sensory protein [Brumimicrobium sp.]|nr:tryptophan-rich sensory protein [Brumimicrobium sp.]